MDASLASGSYVGNGGDTIYCKASRDNDFKGHYTLDYLLEFRQTNVGPVKIGHFSETVLRLKSYLSVHYPELFEHFTHFIAAVRANEAMNGRHWVEERNGLVEIEDESIQKLIPENCLSLENGEYKLKLHQTVVRESSKDPIIYHYDDKVLENLEKNNPLQYSFFTIHEWLWDLTRDVRAVRKLNWLLHSENLKAMSRSDITNMFDRLDVFKVKLSFCERSSQIKSLLRNSCDNVQLNDLAKITSINVINELRSPFRMGDFYGFGRVENLSLSGLNLETYDILPRLFFPLYKLRSLNLSHNNLFDLSDEVTVDLKDLRELDFSFNPISDIPSSFQKLKELEVLTISLNEYLLLKTADVENLPTSLKTLILVQGSASQVELDEATSVIRTSRPNLIIMVKK